MTPGDDRPRLGRLLVERGLMNEDELDRVLDEHERSGRPIGEVAKDLGLISAPQLADVLATQQAWRPLGWMLIDRGLLSRGALDECLREQQRTNRKLGDIILARRLVPAAALEEIAAEQYRLEVELERGFGGGLRQEIERRHQLRRQGGAAPAEESGEGERPLSARLEAGHPHAPDPVQALQEQLDEREETVAALGAAHRRKTEEVERLTAELHERDTIIADLERRLEAALGGTPDSAVAVPRLRATS